MLGGKTPLRRRSVSRSFVSVTRVSLLYVISIVLVIKAARGIKKYLPRIDQHRQMILVS